jgi:hypothetical protein
MPVPLDINISRVSAEHSYHWTCVATSMPRLSWRFAGLREPTMLDFSGKTARSRTDLSHLLRPCWFPGHSRGRSGVGKRFTSRSSRSVTMAASLSAPVPTSRLVHSTGMSGEMFE